MIVKIAFKEIFSTFSRNPKVRMNVHFKHSVCMASLTWVCTVHKNVEVKILATWPILN
jgi:hypothetical protein